MAVIETDEYVAYSRGSGLSLDDIYVEFKRNQGGQEVTTPVRLSDLEILVVSGSNLTSTTRDYRKITSYSDFIRNLNAGVLVGNVKYRVNGQSFDVPRIGNVESGGARLVTRKLTIPTQYESTYVTATGDDIFDGLKRVNPVIKQDSFKSARGQYAYVKLDNESNYCFLGLSQIGYYENGAFVSLVGKNVSDFENKNLFTSKGKRVSNIYVGSTFTFSKAIAQERIDLATLTRETYEFDKDGNVVKETNGQPKMHTESIDGAYSEQIFRKIDGAVRLEVRNFNIKTNGSGEYLQLTIKGQSVPVMVSIDSLFTMNASGGADKPLKYISSTDSEYKEFINQLVGQRLLIKQDDNYIETEPLTFEQASFTYSVRKQRIASYSKDDVLADNAVLKLADGRFINEKSVVRPIAYDYTNDDNFDAYYVTYTDSTGKQQGMIVGKDIFDKSPERMVAGVKIHLSNAHKLKRSAKALKECDIIQTTNKPGDYAHDCLVIKKPNSSEKIATDEQILEQQKRVIEAYKKGEYALEYVVDDKGELVKLAEGQQRYLDVDYRYETDYANQKDNYNFLKMNPLKYDARKDELIGGPHFDLKKANKEGFKVWGEWMARFAGAGTSLAGILVLVAVPAVAIALAGAAVGSAIGIPIVNGIRAYNHNHRQYKYKDKTEVNRKERTKQVEKELQQLYDNIKEQTANIDKNAKLSPQEKEQQKAELERKFLYAYDQINETMLSMHRSKYYSEFKVVNGVAEVNEGNAPLMSEYREMMTGLKKKITKLEKAVKRDPTLKLELDNLKAEYEGKLTSYSSQGQITEKDKSLDQLEAKAERMRGLVLAKMFGKTDNLTADEIRALDSFEYKDGVEFSPVKLSKEEKKELDKEKRTERENELNQVAISLRKKLKNRSKGVEYVSKPIVSKYNEEANPTPAESVSETEPTTEAEHIQEVNLHPEHEQTRRATKTRGVVLKVDEVNKTIQKIKDFKKLISNATSITPELENTYNDLKLSRAKKVLQEAMKTFINTEYESQLNSREVINALKNIEAIKEKRAELKKLAKTAVV